MKILIFSCAYTLALLLLWPVLAVVAIWYSLFPNPLDRGLTKWLILILEINEFSYPANHVLYGGWQLNWYWHWKSMKFYESNLSFEHVCSLFFFDVLVTVTFHQVGQKSIFFVVELCSCDDSKHRKQISNGPCLFCPCYSLVEVQLEPDRHCSQRPFWFLLAATRIIIVLNHFKGFSKIRKCDAEIPLDMDADFLNLGPDSPMRASATMKI